MLCACVMQVEQLARCWDTHCSYVHGSAFIKGLPVTIKNSNVCVASSIYLLPSDNQFYSAHQLSPASAFVSAFLFSAQAGTSIPARKNVENLLRSDLDLIRTHPKREHCEQSTANSSSINRAVWCQSNRIRASVRNSTTESPCNSAVSLQRNALERVAIYLWYEWQFTTAARWM